MFDSIDEYSNRIAIIEGEKEITYSDLSASIDELTKNINGRTLVFVVCTNTYSSLVGYVGFVKNKIVPLMINAAIDKAMFDNLREVYKPEYIWQPKGFSQGNTIYSDTNYELIKDEVDIIDIHPDLALLLTTSGSTGSPKFVKQTYTNIESNATSIIEYLGMEADDRSITSLPMSYTYGLSIINSHLSIGASVVLTQASIVQKEFYDLIEKYKVNNFGGVPYTYEMLLKMRFERMNMPSIKYLTQAGGKLGKENHQKYVEICERKGIKFIVMYGQTEATARMSWLPWEKSKDKVGSIGIAIPRGEFEIWDVDNKPVTEANIQGELVYKGPNVTMGYATKRADLATPDERDGLLITGDMAYRDEDGYYYICGRKKRFLKVYGNRINLDELDSMMKEEGYVAVAAGTDDHVKVYVEQGDKDKILEMLSHRLNINKKAFEAVDIDVIPRNEAGKVLYSKL